MLVSLYVKNLALIRETEVLFGPGLNILTGETGAGKSIVLGSVALALGAKADREMIRTGAESALIELDFEVSGEISRELEKLEILAEDGHVVLQRKILPGRSVCRVNGETVSARVLRQLAGLLIDIHGQHDSQMLLQAKKHLEILDSYAADSILPKKEKMKAAWKKYAAVVREIEENALDESSRKRELSLAQFELEEIGAAALQEGEDEQLEREYRRMANSKKIGESLGAVYALTGDFDGRSAGESTGRALRELSGVVSFDETLQDFYSQLSEVDGLLSDFNRSVSSYMSDLEFDPAQFQDTQDRLNEINRLKDKYGGTIAGIRSYEKKRQEEADRLLHQEEWLEQKRREADAAKKEMLAVAGELGGLRREAAGRFCRQMREALQDLNFLHVEFSVSLTQKEQCTQDGWDDAVFMISTNPGEPLKPLASVASGGELSRIMLALKTVTAGQEFAKTFIFDEIDAGISGKTAWQVSGKLGLLAQNHQIICITHLPQIAAMADRHFYIEKNAVGESTATTIRLLEETESLRELARLSGAADLTEGALKNAAEMKELAEKNRRKGTY